MILTLIYEDFLQKVLSIQTGNVCDFKHVDIYRGQYLPAEDEPDEHPYNTPAVFIEFLPFDLQALGNRRMAALLRFRLHCVFDVVPDQSSEDSLAIRNSAYAHLLLVDKVINAFKGSRNDDIMYNSISWKGYTPYQHNGMEIIHIPEFETRITTTDYMRTMQSATPNLVLTMNMPGNSPPWILASGKWNNAGYWINTATWKNS